MALGDGMLLDETAEEFSGFVRAVQSKLRQSLIAALGAEAGLDATAEALAWAWENWPRLSAMDNPAGYLYRVGRNRGISMLRRKPIFPPVLPDQDEEVWVEPGLPAAIARLPEMQRVTVLLVHAFGWSYREVASHLGVAVSTVQQHVARGMAKLRNDLKVDLHA